MSGSAGAAVLAALRKQWLQSAAEGRVLLAISGGVDSMVLLEGLARILREPDTRTRLLVVHVNHALRGEESDGDEALVLARAAELGLEARAFRLDWSDGTPTQNECRRRRDELFRSLSTGVGDRVWLAHHLNDQAETVFFRLLRGTGAKGLRGMLPVSGIKVRPFLGLEKAQLLRAAADWGVTWREDRSNLNAEAYERNWIRGFFPALEARRPGFQRKLAALAEEARGWQFVPEPALDRYSPAPGIEFVRGAGSVPTGVLSSSFRLSRAHARELHGLLSKPAGRLDVEGARFWWSAGLLLHEEGVRFEPDFHSLRATGLRSALGAWELPPGLALWEEAGERRKKELQSLRVPGFFRGGIPLVGLAGRPVALLPRRLREPRLAEIAGLRFTPSPLGAWWLGGK